jgi:hypothetical protein
MANFDFLKKYIPGGSKVNDNWFLQVTEDEIVEAEKNMRASFPAELRQFYKDIGHGMLRSSHIVPKDYNFGSKNEILPPHIAVDYMQGILEHPDDDCYYMSETEYSFLEEGDLPFFEIGDGSAFLTLKTHSNNPNAVWNWEILIEESFERFIYRLYYESPGFYGEIIEKHYAELERDA